MGKAQTKVLIYQNFSVISVGRSYIANSDESYFNMLVANGYKGWRSKKIID